MISIIVPVYNNACDLRKCLAALLASATSNSEIVVVDDASTDDTASVAAEMGVRLLRLARNSGPAAARNHGVRHTRGDVLLFVDADVVVAPGAVRRVARVLMERPDLAAVFGSYDTRPSARGVVSQFRNLLHHFVHQHGNPDASSFWAGCGAVRRRAFEALGGFDEERHARAIQDIELGYRLRDAGHRILLDKGLRVTHLKRWTLYSVVRTDVARRAVPWARLILQRATTPRDLNVTGTQRLSVALVGVAGVLLLLGLFRAELGALAVVPLIAVLVLNRDLYRFLYRQRGLVFTIASVPLHLLYFVCCAVGFSYVWLSLKLGPHGNVSRNGTSGCHG